MKRVFLLLTILVSYGHVAAAQNVSGHMAIQGGAIRWFSSHFGSGTIEIEPLEGMATLPEDWQEKLPLTGFDAATLTFRFKARVDTAIGIERWVHAKTSGSEGEYYPPSPQPTSVPVKAGQVVWIRFRRSY